MSVSVVKPWEQTAENPSGLPEDQEVGINPPAEDINQVDPELEQLLEDQKDLLTGVYSDPASVIEKASTPEGMDTSTGVVDSTTGQLTGTAPQLDTAKVDTTQEATPPVATPASVFDATPSAQRVEETLEGVERDYKVVDPADVSGFTGPPPGALVSAALETFHNPTTGEVVTFNTGGNTAPEGWVKGAPEGKFKTEGVTPAQGEVSQEAQVEAQTSDELRALELQAEQIAQAQTVQAPADRVLEEGELIEGSAVDMDKVNKAVQVQTAQADPSVKATVQGQMAELTENFDVTNPPPWAAGAIRSANAQMAARGLGSSTIAGQAILQSALESALPIAMQDAQTAASFELENLSNRQQSALFAAQARAEFLGMEFTQEFQARVANSARIGEIANINFTADQQIALENARMAQTVDIANLDAKNAKILADAAALTQLDLTNLNNRQQAAVSNAQAFLQMDLTNLSNEQQTSMFKAQSRIQSILSDTAAENASRQFNAASENQTNQFFAGLEAQVSQFNAAQNNAMEQFNAGQENAMEQFNANLQNQRDQFNAANSLIIAQANAQWRQSVETTEYAAQHEANMAAATATNGLTAASLDQLWQRERDLMSFAFTASESAMDRTLSLLLGDKKLDALRMELNAQEEAGKGSLFSRFLFGSGGTGGWQGLLGSIF